MKAYLKQSLFLSGCLVQCLPLFLQAQMNSLPHSIPSAEVQTLPPTSSNAKNSPENAMINPIGTNRITDILNFWFGYLSAPDYFPREKFPMWFSSTPEIDRQIRSNFLQDVIHAERGDYNRWRETPQGRLALILLTDQFPRHIYRNQPQSFMLDRMARALVLEGLQKGDDKQLYPIERAFFYLPLEHSEDLDMQDLSVRSYQQLEEQSPQEIRPVMQNFLEYANKHREQIAHFGRFPHRNAILGRESTPEEIIFLTQPRSF